MYYQTKIKKIHNSGATDLSGKSLEFIGNLPCKEGDVVWTDGTFIFGHVPIRGTPLIPVETGGIPALSDNLRGYFNKSGKFKKYNVALDNWIVNDNKKFYHGSEDLLDAEIADDGDLLTAELSNQEGFSAAFTGAFNILEIVRESSVIIKKGGEVIKELPLADFVDIVKKTVSISNNYGILYIFVDSFKFLPDGNWDCILKTAISVGEKSDSLSSSEIPGISADLPEEAFYDWRVFYSFDDDNRFNQDKFLNSDLPLDYEEFDGDPLLKRALLAVWQKILYYGDLDGNVGYHGEKLAISFLAFNDSVIFRASSDEDSNSGGNSNANGITYLGTSEYIIHVKSTGDSEYSTNFFFGNDSQAQNSGRTYINYRKPIVGKGEFDKYYPEHLPATTILGYSGHQAPLAIVVVADNGDIVFGPDIGLYAHGPTSEQRQNYLRGVWSYSCYPLDDEELGIKGTEFIFYRKYPNEGQTAWDAVGSADPNGFSYYFAIDDDSPFIEGGPQHHHTFDLVHSDEFYYTRNEHLQTTISIGSGDGGSAPAPDSEFQFTVQDGFYATIKNGMSRKLFAPDNSVVADNFFHDTFNFSATKLNNGNFVFGKYGNTAVTCTKHKATPIKLLTNI